MEKWNHHFIKLINFVTKLAFFRNQCTNYLFTTNLLKSKTKRMCSTLSRLYPPKRPAFISTTNFMCFDFYLQLSILSGLTNWHYLSWTNLPSDDGGTPADDDEDDDDVWIKQIDRYVVDCSKVLRPRWCRGRSSPGPPLSWNPLWSCRSGSFTFGRSSL